MDKVQMTVTLVEPDLLAYLRQFSDPRERSFMLRMLALRGLQSDGPAGKRPWSGHQCQVHRQEA